MGRTRRSRAKKRCASTPSAASYYVFEEERKGSIEPGKLTDLAVLSADFMTVGEEEIKDIKADLTVVGGKVVFQR